MRRWRCVLNKTLDEMLRSLDLKPENLLLTSSGKFPRIMLADFGMAREQKHNRLMSTMCGTFAYM